MRGFLVNNYKFYNYENDYKIYFKSWITSQSYCE